MRNSFKTDPSKTGLIRYRWVQETEAKFSTIRQALRKYLVDDDVLSPVLVNAKKKKRKPKAKVVKKRVKRVVKKRFVFKTSAAKLKAFNKWFKTQIDNKVLIASPNGEPKGTKPWNAKYVNHAYRQGAMTAFVASNKTALGKKMAHTEGTKEEFLRSAFARPERVDKLKLLYTRSYEDLKGVTATMAAKMSRELADGMAKGDGPASIARRMDKTITGLTRKRANVIARTETIHAHAEGQLDGLEDMGVTSVKAQVEFSTAGDDGVCPVCDTLSGKVYTTAEARGVIPVHPNCRCCWVPYIDVDAILRKGKKK